ncbi:Pyruvate/Phosphoenolpyruvate kinase [Forsythia ovata]|uniref:Pyruvate/Phosphoenolpyruvate kinase n=1 Tax=Forsythia ovata TaxID=205694 RepID=A0ABD1PV94_9LAMI
MLGFYDALSASIVQKSGFSAGFISGYALSASLLGKLDFGLLAYLRSQCPKDHQDLIAAGAAGCFLEAIPAEEHAAKIACARDAIGDSDFFLMARTDAQATSANMVSRMPFCGLIFKWSLKFVALSETAVALGRFELRRMLRAVQEYKVTHVAMAPPVVAAMLNAIES